MIRRRHILALLPALALILAACGSGGSSSSVSTSSGSTSAAPNPNGVLRYGEDLNNEFSNNFDPGTGTNDCSFSELSQIYSSITAGGSPPSSPSGNTLVAGGVAQSWQLQGTTLTLNIRPGIHFTDGTPVDANAVMQSIQHIRMSPLRTSLLAIHSMDVVNPGTLVIHLSSPTGGDLLSAFSFIDGMVMAPASIPNAASSPVGSGPFKLKSYQQGAAISLIANKEFWDASRYKLGGVNFVEVTPGPQTVGALISGAIDIADLLPEDVASVRSDSNLGVSVTQSSQYMDMQLRQTEAPFNNPKVRAALEYAIDRQTINQVAQGGLGQPAWQPFPTWQAGFNPSVGTTYRYDPAKAKSMLAAAGYGNGVSFTMVIPAGATLYSRAAGLMQNEMAAAGFHVSIQQVPGGDYLTDVFEHGQGNALLSENSDNGPDLANNFESSFTPIGFIAKSFGSVNPQITALVAQAITSLDPGVQGPPMQEASKLVMEQGLEVPVVYVPQILAYNKTTVGGNPQAPFGFCKANLAGIYMKR